MDPVQSQIATSLWPSVFATFAAVVGALGAGSAFIAYALTSRDRDSIKKAAASLAASESWDGAHGQSEHELSNWLEKRGIGVETGVADVIRACWSAWLGSRAATLTELHVLVARRERSKIPARLSAGIATLLLVIGIVGTLLSVKPILKAFQFKVSTPEDGTPLMDDPVLSNVAESTELVNSLMHSLGDAFLPSLVALGFTIIVVSLRGLYFLNLNRYTLELDRFAMGTVMPHYQPRSIAGEYDEVRSTFGSLAKAIGDREERFAKVVEQLTKFVDSVKPTLSGLEGGAAKMSAAADSLASKANSIATTLTRTLGKKSPLYAVVNGFEGIFARTNDELDKLSQHIVNISKTQDETGLQMRNAVDQLAEAIKTIGSDHKQDRQDVSMAILDVEALVSELPNQVVEVSREIIDGDMAEMKKSLSTFIAEQKSDIVAAKNSLRNEAIETLASISKTLDETTRSIADSSRDIPDTLGKLNDSLSRKTETEKAAVEAIRSAVEEARSQISNIKPDPSWERSTEALESINKTLSETADSIANSAKCIPETLEQLNGTLIQKNEIERAGVEAIRAVAEEAKYQIAEMHASGKKGQVIEKSTPQPGTESTALVAAPAASQRANPPKKRGLLGFIKSMWPWR